MKTIYDFQFKETAYKKWDNPLSPSNEGLVDWSKDKLSASFSEKDLLLAKNHLELIQRVSNLPLKSNKPLAILNGKKSVLSFYTKKGKIIDSFSEELEEQIRSLEILSVTIKKITSLIHELKLEASEIEALGSLNDANILPILKRASSLSFLGSIYLESIENKSFNTIQIKRLNKEDRLKVEKQIYALHWIKHLLVGVLKVPLIPFKYYGDIKEALNQNAVDATFDISAIVINGTISETRRELAKTNSVIENNEKVNIVLDEILEASSISSTDFHSKTKLILDKSAELLESIEHFHALDKEYVKSDNTLIRWALRTVRVLSVFGLEVLSREGIFYKAILKNSVD